MAYTTFAFYRDEYGGAMDEAAFCRFAPRAGYVLEAITQDRVKSLFPAPEESVAVRVATAACILADGIARTERTEGRTVTLEAVGKHRIAYAKSVQDAARDLHKDVQACLAGVCDGFGVPLLYRGAGREHPA